MRWKWLAVLMVAIPCFAFADPFVYEFTGTWGNKNFFWTGAADYTLPDERGSERDRCSNYQRAADICARRARWPSSADVARPLAPDRGVHSRGRVGADEIALGSVSPEAQTRRHRALRPPWPLRAPSHASLVEGGPSGPAELNARTSRSAFFERRAA